MKSNSKKRKLDSSGAASASIAKSKKKSGKGWAKKNIWRRKRNGHEVKTQGVEKASENKFQPLKLLGSKGFLFTCDPHRQREAVREAYNVLNEYADEYFPQPVPEVSPTNDKGEEKVLRKRWTAMTNAQRSQFRTAGSRHQPKILPLLKHGS